MLGAGLILIIFFSNGFIFEEIMRCWEIQPIHDKNIKSYDAGIVLGGIISYEDELDRIQFYRSSDRLFQAVNLYKKGKIKKIIFAGGSGSLTLTGLKEAPLVTKYLSELGIPTEDILYESQSRNTHENAKYIKGIIKENEKYLLITSAYHMRRSLACFDKAGIKTFPYSTDQYSGSRRFYFDHLFIPDIQFMYEWDVLIHEIVGYCVYKVMGYA